MKVSLKNLFRKAPTQAPAGDLRLAVAELLLEIARSDAQVGAAELQTIRTHLASAFGLEAAQLDSLMDQAARNVEQAISLHDTVRHVNERYTPEEKTPLIRALWQVAYADQRLDAYEEALLRRLADLLYVPHSIFIREKLASQG